MGTDDAYKEEVTVQKKKSRYIEQSVQRQTNQEEKETGNQNLFAHKYPLYAYSHALLCWRYQRCNFKPSQQNVGLSSQGNRDKSRIRSKEGLGLGIN